HLAVASSKPEVFVKKILEHFGMMSWFEVVVGSGLDGSRVRKEEVLEEALRQLLGESVPAKETSAYAEDVVMVGDRKFDIQGAKAYGIVSVGVAYGYAAEGELEEAGADRIVKTVQELEEALLR
ncbi:MAG: HAD hydrolase-like protein, partial [Lachnospiraceae bacterium]|nr:HAD hydrolase-like protein [Lachnospiraceae bacterium]